MKTFKERNKEAVIKATEMLNKGDLEHLLFMVSNVQDRVYALEKELEKRFKIKYQDLGK